MRPLLAMLMAMAMAFPAWAQLAHTHGTAASTHAHDDLESLLNEHDQEIHFVENKGQFSKPVLFRADLPMGQAVATKEGMVITAFDPASVLQRQAEGIAIEQEREEGLAQRPLTWRKKGHTWRLTFSGASKDMTVESRTAHEGVTNYFLGNASATDVRSFQEVWYRNTYRNVDVRYYPAEDGTLEYDILCKPGSDPGQVAITFDGIDKISVNGKGELVLHSSLGELTYPAPVVYQRINGKEKAVKSSYVVKGRNELGFSLGDYDKSETLVIDPIALRWATWVNTASTGDNHGHCIWVDPTDGAIYVVARVVGSTDQITPGAFDETANGNLETIIGKYLEPATIGASGTRVWQTYIGGNGDDNPYAMEQGPDGNLYITGYTSSTNFPLLGGTAFSGSSINQQAQAGENIFVMKINPAGNSIKASVLGGNGDEESYDLRLAPNGDVLVGGHTTSTNLLTLNSGSGATNGNSGGTDVLLFRLNQDLSSLVWMRNYGGSGNDRASIMLYNPATNDLFVGGNTSSTNFPTVSPRQSTRGGSSAGFLQRLNGNTAATVWSSYYSSASSQNANLLCMEFNAARTELYFGGVTTGLNAANITSGSYDTSHNGNNDFYVGHMTIDQTLLQGTYVGGSSNEVNMMGLNVDLNNDVYVFGYTNSTNFPVSSAPNVPLQTTNNGSNDKVFFKLKNDLATLIFSTYYGGTSDDYDPVGERGIKFSNCRIYTIVTARSNNIPLTQGALNTTKNSSTSRYEPGLVVWANPPDLMGNTISGNQTVCTGTVPGDVTGSIPQYVLPTIVRNNSPSSYPSFGSAATYQWQISSDSLSWVDIPGATSQNLPGSAIGEVEHKTFIRRIIGGDACILAGAADQVVTVKVIEATAQITHVSCNGAHDGSITASSTGTGPFTYSWSNGSTGATISGLAPGDYTVTVTDVSGCQATQTFTVTEPAVLGGSIAGVNATCNNSDGSATMNATGGTSPYSYLWSNGGTTATINNLAAGTYSVVVTDAHSCTFETSTIISASGTPGADAGLDMVITCATNGQAILNGSTGASGVSYGWSASNGGHIVSGANTLNPTVDAAGTYTLVVTYTSTGCSSSDDVSVTTNMSQPGASASVDQGLTCSITSVTLQGSSSTSGVTYGWSGPNGFTSTEQNPTVSEPGTYTLVVTDNANGCSSSDLVNVTQDIDAPGANAQGGTLTCAVTSIQLQGSGNGSYSWSGPNGFTSTDQNPTVNEAGTYTLTVTGANGCTSTASA
ncbi:MAG: hypothetical protein OZ932_12535, partial [Flavobacteriia bacterium]|nr:hypothetical protein [Flavobacteriia bacterium]